MCWMSIPKSKYNEIQHIHTYLLQFTRFIYTHSGEQVVISFIALRYFL